MYRVSHYVILKDERLHQLGCLVGHHLTGDRINKTVRGQSSDYQGRQPVLYSDLRVLRWISESNALYGDY